MKLRHVCVFCGSNFGDSDSFLHLAQTVGKSLAERNIGLVYGGGTRGLMGEVARVMKDAGSHVVGISPKRFYKPEYKQLAVDEFIVVDTMHERKALMYEKADAFIALPGGVGTLEELAEIITWRQIGFTNKPCAILNHEGFYTPLLEQLELMHRRGFTRTEQWDQVIVAPSITEILDTFDAYVYEKAPWER